MLTGYFLLICLIVLQGIPYLMRKTPLFAKLFLACSFVELWLLATLRAPTFITDDLGYLEMFYFPGLCYVEWGYCQLSKFIHFFGVEQYILFGGLALLVFGGMAVFIYRYSSNMVVSVLTYICLMYAFNSLNGIRQFLALSIIFIGFPFVQKRKFWFFLCVVLLASLFHKSAIICLSFYWLYTIKVNWKTTSLLVLGCLMVCLGFEQLSNLYTNFGGDYAHYVSAEAESGRLATIIRLIVNGSVALFALTFLGQSVKIYNSSAIPINFLILCACISVTGALVSLQAYNAERLVYYFYFFNMITIPNLLGCVRDKALKRLLCLVILLCLVAYGGVVLWSWETQGIIYKFMWSV